MARNNSTDFNRCPTDHRSPSSPAASRVATIRGERQLIQRLLVFLADTNGHTLDVPVEFAPLADSRFVMPTSATACLGMGVGPHTAGQVVQRFNALRVLTTAIDEWAQQPVEQRGQLADYLRCYVPGRLPAVTLDTVLKWARTLRAPVGPELAERLRVRADSTWGSAVQTLLPDPALAPTPESAVKAAPLPSASPTPAGPVPSAEVVPSSVAVPSE